MMFHVFHENSLCTLPYVKKTWVLASRESYSLLQFLLSTIYLVEVSMPATMVDITNGKAVNGPRMRLNETRQLWNHIVSSQATLTV